VFLFNPADNSLTSAPPIGQGHPTPAKTGTGFFSWPPDMEAPLIRAYPREASIAEKFHAMVMLDIRNGRMKDFYDIWFMANTGMSAGEKMAAGN
jgi:hypothetical protein